MTEDRTAFRYTIGTMALVGGLAGLAGLFFIEVPEGNREPMLLALGIILGWGATIIGYEFGSSPAGRKAADAGLKSPDAPAGTPSDPVNVVEPKP